MDWETRTDCTIVHTLCEVKQQGVNWHIGLLIVFGAMILLSIPLVLKLRSIRNKKDGRRVSMATKSEVMERGSVIDFEDLTRLPVFTTMVGKEDVLVSGYMHTDRKD